MHKKRVIKGATYTPFSKLIETGSFGAFAIYKCKFMT